MNDLMTKSFTSYVDLKKSAMKDQEMDLEAQHEHEHQNEVEMSASDPGLGVFLEEAERVKQEMCSLRDILGKLERANEESKTLHKLDALKALRARINADIVSVLKKARSIRVQLEAMDSANANADMGQKEGSPTYRTRKAVTGGLRMKLREVMMEFQELRQRMMAEYKETVGRRYFTVTGEAPDEAVIERIIADGGEELLTRAVQEHGRGRVVEAVAEIQDRHGAAREIEASLLELHQVFLDMAVMVEAQGDHIDDIEHHVITASHYVADGTKHLKDAKNYQKSSRKCMFLALILLLLLILVIVIPIIISFSSA